MKTLVILYILANTMAVPDYNGEDSTDVDMYVHEPLKDKNKVLEESVVETDSDSSTCDENVLSVQNLEPDNFTSFPAKPITRKTNFAVLLCVLGCIMMSFKRIRWQEQNKRMSKSKIDIDVIFSKHKAKIKELKEHPKTRLWINKLVKTFYHIPRTIVQTYVLNPQDYSNFIKEQKTGLTSSLKESMQFEWCRLASFANYPNTNISVIRLAEAGFHYEGNENEVVCFFCGLKYKNWKSNESPVQVHKDNAPQCSFVVNNLNIKTRINDRPTSDISVGACGNSAEAPNLSEVKENKEGDTSSARDKKTNETCSENNVAIDRNRCIIENNVTADDDSRLEKESIENSSSPRRASWEFPAFSRTNVSGLISIPENNRGLESTFQSPRTPVPVSSLTSNMEALSMGVCLEKPKYPKYAIRTTRLSSFANWPSYLSQTPDELVTAGFFYTGIEDHCRCFFCGGGLRRWEVGDLPWTEHARWYPKCQFVKQCMGEKFIEDVKHGKNPENILNSSHSEQKIEPKGLNGYTNNPAVQTILEFGYEPNVVKSAYTSLQIAGVQDITASLLFETINEKEEREQTQSACNHPVKSSIKEAHEENNHIQDTHKDEQARIDPDIELSVKSLEEENRNLKDQQTCKICLDKPVSIVFLPCGHMAACINCAPALRRCPICRAFIKGTVKAIMC